MHSVVDRKLADLRGLCRRFAVARLDLFGSAARGADFDPETSDLDFLVEFEAPGDDLLNFLDFRDALQKLFNRPIDLVDRKEIETSRNYIRRQHVLSGVEPVYGA